PASLTIRIHTSRSADTDERDPISDHRNTSCLSHSILATVISTGVRSSSVRHYCRIMRRIHLLRSANNDIDEQDSQTRKDTVRQRVVNSLRGSSGDFLLS